MLTKYLNILTAKSLTPTIAHDSVAIPVVQFASAGLLHTRFGKYLKGLTDMTEV